MNAVVGCEEVVNLSNNSDDLGKVESISNVTLEEEEEFFDAMEEQESISNVEEGNNLDPVTSEEEEFFDALEEQEPLANFNVPLSIFHYKDYNSDFFTSWYNISSEIFKEINRACPEKKVLNLALSVLIFPYIVFTALGLAVYNKLKTNDKTQISSEENKTKKSEVSESTAKRLAYGVLAAVAILVSMPILLLLLIPATPALATFYLLNRKLSHSLVAAVKISNGLYQNEHQNIEVSFHEIDAGKSDIKWDMEIKFPPQFEQLFRDLYEDENGKWFDVTRDSEHNTILKLSANINLKNGLTPLRNEIKNVLATSIQEFAKTMEELMKLEKKDITYDKLKELLNEFRLKIVDSVDPKLTTHLIENAYQVAFIQAIKFAQERKGDFSEDVLRDILVKQELESQGKELPSEKEMIIKDLKKAGAKVPDDLDDRGLPVFKAVWEQLIKEKKIAKRTIIDMYPKETAEALCKAKETIKELKGMGEKRYSKIHEELKEVYENRKDSNLKDDALKRRLEDLFKFEYNDQEVERRLIKSVMKKAQGELSRLGILEKQGLERFKQRMHAIWNLLFDKDKEQSLMTRLKDLEKNEKTSAKINDFVEKMYLEVTKCKMQNLFKGQAKGIENSCKLLEEKAPALVERINAHRVEIARCLEQPVSLRKVIEGNEDLNKYLEDERNSKGEEHPNTKLIEQHLKNNQEILKALEQLELKKEGLLINEETKNNYREELESREKIKFAVIEDKLLEEIKKGNFDEAEIKKLFEKAEFEYCLAERCIKYPVIKTKDNIKHFSQNLLSPLIDRLVENIVNNVPKSDKSSWLQSKKSLGIVCGYVRMGWSATKKNESIEGKALDAARDTHKEIETFLQHFESSYEEVGALIGDVFSDDGKTFKNDVWPKVEEHLHGIWDRFFKDVEFKVGSRLDEISLAQPKQETMIVAQL
ncbi:hypothetical protein [Wolbachia endosymbiont of Oedothorax gibbosus]|uniref:hypothetical protein n=1 Tax=Wolbachia endosymbiont of Oedothorax gibbosus TaxID=931100 RepID=UPI002023E07B|nr:hypothetical protein [Wolbachia endosymbiont of Oedothorax gibbosus]